MQYLIWIGTVISVIGLAGILFSIVRVMKAKKEDLTDEEMRARISKILPVNLGALFLSVIGLMMVILGISFG